MRICLSGAQCTGKTTLLKLIESSGTFAQYDFFKEIVRTLVAKENIKINEESHHQSQMRIFEEHYKNILKSKNFITDRCAVDAYAYASWGYIHNKFSAQEHREHLELFKNCVRNYDIIFHLPADFPIVDDGFRSTDNTFRHEIDCLFRGTFDTYNIPNASLIGTPEEKFIEFQDVIKQNFPRRASK